MTWFDWNAELQSPALGCAQYTAVKYISDLFLPLSEGRKELCHEYNGAFRNLLTWTSRQPPRTSKQMLSNVSTTSQNTLMTTKYEFCNQNNHGQVLHIFSLVKNAEFGLHCNKPSETGPKKKKKKNAAIVLSQLTQLSKHMKKWQTLSIWFHCLIRFGSLVFTTQNCTKIE